MTFGLFGCSKPPEDKLAIIKGQAYLIPWQDKPKVTPISWRENEPHVRIHNKKLPGGQSISLLFDPRNYSIEAAANIPNLFGFSGRNEVELREEFIEIPSSDFSIFCERRSDGLPMPAPRSCGFRVQDGDVSWSVDFSSNDIDYAPMMKEEAARILKSYREAANAK